MKKLLTFLLTALLAFGVGWAETATFDLSTAASTNGTVISTLTDNGVTITFSKANGSTNPAWYSGAVRLYASGTLDISCSSDKTISSIAFTGSTASSTTNGGLANWSTTSGNYEITKTTSPCTASWTGSESSLTFTVQSGKRVYLTSIVVTFSGGSTPPVADNWYRKVTSASDLFAGNKYIIVNEASGVGMGELNTNRYGTVVSGLTFDNGRVNIGGTDVMELILGGSLGAWTFRMGENGNYLSNSNSSNNQFFSSQSVNNSATDLTKWTITPGDNARIQSNYVTSQYIRFNSGSSVFGTYGVNSQSAVALYVQDDGFTGVGTINEANSLEANTNFRFAGDAVVTYQNGNNLWIRDASGSGLIYGSVSGTFANGAVLDAGWTATKSTSNYGVPQFTSPNGVSSSSSTTAAPEALTTITTDDVNKYVSLSNLKITDAATSSGITNYTVDGVSYVLRNQFGLVTLTTGKTYNVVGVVSIYNNQPQLYLISAEELAVPTILVSPNPMTFNDSGTGNTFTVEGFYLGGDNVGLTQDGSYFTPTLSASTGYYDGGTYWYFTPASGSVNGSVAMSYTGRELSASETVTLANNLASTTVTVNYRADVYILGNYGNSGWDYSNGIQMTYDATNNTYTASVTANVGDLIVFARKLGESNPWNTRILFGPNSNGDWWVNSSPNPKEGTIDLNDDDPIYFNCAGTYTIEINATTGAITVTREPEFSGNFVLVTDVNDLVAGNQIIFVSSGSVGLAEAMSTEQRDNNRGVTDVNVVAGLKVDATETTQIFTLEAAAGGWYFKTVNGDSQGYIYAASSSSNYLKTEATADDNAKATISLASDGAATIIFQGNYTRNHMRYNSSNNPHIYSCYAETSTVQNLPYIYMREASTEPSISVSTNSLDLTIPAGNASVSGNVTVTENNTTGTTSVSITGEAAGDFTANLENGTLTVTYSGDATQDAPDAVTVTLTNGDVSVDINVTGYRIPLAVTIHPASGATFSHDSMNGTIEVNNNNAIIYYKTNDMDDWAVYTDGFTVTNNLTEAPSVQAYAVITDGDYIETSETVTATYSHVSLSETLFTRVTSTDQLVAGNKYIIVYEDAQDPRALYGNGKAAAVVWSDEDINIAGTSTTVFTLGENLGENTLYYDNNGTPLYLTHDGKSTIYSGTANSLTIYGNETDGYFVQEGSYNLRYNTGVSQTNDPFRWYDNGASSDAVLYVQGMEIQPTSATLAVIESTPSMYNTTVVVASELIGTWAVVDGNTKLLWAKDQGNVSIDKRPAKTDGQADYVKDILKYKRILNDEVQQNWDESNWVILDFSGIDDDPFEFVGHKISANSVKGEYSDNVNYKMTLTDSPVLLNEDPYTKDVPEFTGYEGPFPENKLGTKYDLAYNSYVPANFMTENHNHMVEGNVVGFVADDGALPGCKGDSLYFVNPKIQEVAHIWAVWNGGDEDLFTVYRTEQKELENGKKENINAWHLNGTFRVNWAYNCTGIDPNNASALVYDRPENLVPNMAYEFHAVVMRPTNGTRLTVAPQGTANPSAPSQDYMIYPLDMSNGGTPTAVIELNANKTVVSVTYYNLMGVESRKPFEGVNIVVTRYSDGSIMTQKVLR